MKLDLIFAEINAVLQTLGAEQCAQLTSNLDAQIANPVNAPVVTPPLPWVE